MTWSRQAGELILCFNRDEQHTRAESLPPRVWPEGFLAPVDGDAQGTWLAVKPDGTVLALLNHYPPGFAKRTTAPSRGALVAALAAHPERPTPALLRRLGMESMNPFRLVALSMMRTVVFTWNGSRLSRDGMLGDIGFITSSSWQTQAVTALRHGEFRHWHSLHERPTLEAMIQFHSLSQHAKGSAWAVCMSRDDARSVSLNTVRISGGLVVMTQQLRGLGEPAFDTKIHSQQMHLTAA